MASNTLIRTISNGNNKINENAKSTGMYVNLESQMEKDTPNFKRSTIKHRRYIHCFNFQKLRVI